MSIQKIYRKYGKRALASILAILLSVQTPLLSYADTSDFEISSYDDFADRPVWDDSDTVDYNSFDELSKRELVPLSQEEIDYIMEHDGEFNPESPLVDDSSENNDALAGDNEISVQSAVAIGAGVTALIIFLLSALSSAEVAQNGNANTLYDSLTSLSQKNSDWFEYFYYRYAGVVYSVKITADKAKSLLGKLDKSLSSDGKTCSVALTTEDKEVLSYALDKEKLITSLDPKSVKIESMDGFNYYYILSCGFDYNMTSSTVRVLCTPNKVDLSDRIYTSYSDFKSRFLFYNALLADQSNPYSSMKYRIAIYKLSSATGLFEYTGDYYEYTATSNGNRYDLNQFGTSELRSLPFPVVGKKGATNFLNYFEVKSALILDESLKGKITSIDSVMGLKSIYYKGDISDVLSTEKNYFGQVTALSPGAGSVLSDSTTKPGAGTGTDTATKQYSRLFYVLRALADKYKISITSAQFNEFIASFYKKYINGTSAEAPDQSKEIMDKFVVINGGKTPNDNNDDNKYNLKKRLVDGFFSFCITAGLITSAPDYSKDTNVKSNVSIDNSDDSSTGGGTNPGGGTNTGGNTSTGSSSDLSGVLEYLKNILSILGVLNAWQNPLSLIDTLVSKLGLENIVSAINNIGDSVASALGLDDLFNSLELPTYFNDLFDILNSWNFANMFSGQTNSLLAPLNNIEYGINTFWNQYIENFNSIGFKDLLTNISRIIEDLPGKLVLGFASSELFSGIGTNIANMPLYLANLLGLGTTTLLDLFNNVVESIEAIPGEIGKIIPPSSGNDNVDDGENNNDSGFKNFLNLFMLTLLIIVLLIILFMNCLRFIVLVFNIPASTTLMHADMLKGIEFMKNLQLPLFGVSLYSLLLSCAYFVIFMTIIMTIRRKIDKLHI